MSPRVAILSGALVFVEPTRSSVSGPQLRWLSRSIFLVPALRARFLFLHALGNFSAALGWSSIASPFSLITEEPTVLPPLAAFNILFQYHPVRREEGSVGPHAATCGAFPPPSLHPFLPGNPHGPVKPCPAGPLLPGSPLRAFSANAVRLSLFPCTAPKSRTASACSVLCDCDAPVLVVVNVLVPLASNHTPFPHF